MTREDPVGRTARHALYRLAFRDPIIIRPWSEIRTSGRRIQRHRVAAGIAGVAIVLTGASAANAVVEGHESGGAVEPGALPLPATTTTTTIRPTALPLKFRAATAHSADEAAARRANRSEHDHDDHHRPVDDYDHRGPADYDDGRRVGDLDNRSGDAFRRVTQPAGSTMVCSSV